jgi:hypothetical protein
MKQLPNTGDTFYETNLELKKKNKKNNSVTLLEAAGPQTGNLSIDSPVQIIILFKNFKITNPLKKKIIHCQKLLRQNLYLGKSLQKVRSMCI